jgi:hypothetical protein
MQSLNYCPLFLPVSRIDFVGRSSEKGALSIRTHHFNATEPILNFCSAANTVAALKIGAGVIAAHAYMAAIADGHPVVGSWCPSVGISGGFTHGCGYSLLTSLHGLGVDNALARVVVTADGTHAVATPERIANLYWALSSGSSGTYAGKVSLAARLHSDNTPTAGVMLTSCCRCCSCCSCS